MSQQLSRAFLAQSYNTGTVEAVIITSEPVSLEVVIAAWSYAVRYTAKGLDLPDYKAAVELLKSRHPSWHVIQSATLPAHVNLAVADNDKPENT
jgi:hypothetical protein